MTINQNQTCLKMNCIGDVGQRVSYIAKASRSAFTFTLLGVLWNKATDDYTGLWYKYQAGKMSESPFSMWQSCLDNNNSSLTFCLETIIIY